MESILNICQEVADIVATQRPDDLFETNFQNNAIFLSLAKNELDSLMRYGNWQSLIKEGELVTVKKKRFYPFEAIVPDFYSLINDTIYVKDQSEKIIGSLTPQEMMKKKYFEKSDSNICFQIESNGFHFLKPPADFVKIVFAYRSNALCVDAKTYEQKSALTQNSDIPIFDGYLVKLGITWRWLKRNGMDYAQEYLDYQKELKKKFGLELSPKDICLSNVLGAAEAASCVCVIKQK